MNLSKIAVRYSKALFMLSLEKSAIDDIFKDMSLLLETCRDKNFSDLLKNPVISSSHKITIFHNIFNKYLHAISISFLDLIVKNKREAHLQDIVRKFISDYKKYKGITSASLITAYNIDGNIKSQIIGLIEKELNSTVEIETTVNTDIIGGYILKIDDKQIDASVSSQLRKIKKELVNNAFDKKSN